MCCWSLRASTLSLHRVRRHMQQCILDETERETRREMVLAWPRQRAVRKPRQAVSLAALSHTGSLKRAHLLRASACFRGRQSRRMLEGGRVKRLDKQQRAGFARRSWGGVESRAGQGVARCNAAGSQYGAICQISRSSIHGWGGRAARATSR